MAKKTTEQSVTTKWEIRREDNACTQVWKYDKTKNKNGPVSVETIWKTWILDEWENARMNEGGRGE